jgi:hypothetical protein
LPEAPIDASSRRTRRAAALPRMAESHRVFRLNWPQFDSVYCKRPVIARARGAFCSEACAHLVLIQLREFLVAPLRLRHLAELPKRLVKVEFSAQYPSARHTAKPRCGARRMLTRGNLDIERILENYPHLRERVPPTLLHTLS